MARFLTPISFFLIIVGLSLSEPTAEDVARSESDAPAQKVSEQAPRFVRPDVRSDRVNWEHSPDAMQRAISYVNRKLSAKYPSQGVKRSKGAQVFVHHKIAYQLVQNITPSGLNTPDTPVQSGQYYMPQGHGVIAVFAIKVKIMRTIVGEQGAVSQLTTFMNRVGMGNSALPTSEEKKQEVDERLYLVSIPREPFQRMLQNPLMNPISAQVYSAGGLEMKQPEVPHKELKALFPSNRARIKKITEDQLKSILSGDFKGEDSDQEE